MALVQSCEVCGIVVHGSCERRLPSTCRPLTEEHHTRTLHSWQAAGVVLEDPEVGSRASTSQEARPAAVTSVHASSALLP